MSLCNWKPMNKPHSPHLFTPAGVNRVLVLDWDVRKYEPSSQYYARSRPISSAS